MEDDISVREVRSYDLSDPTNLKYFIKLSMEELAKSKGKTVGELTIGDVYGFEFHEAKSGPQTP